MASNGIQAGQEDAPAFPEEDALASGADLEEVSRYAKWRGNLLKGTFSAMGAFAAAVEGLFWSDITNKSLMRYDGGWVQHGIEHLGTSTSSTPNGSTFTTTPTTVNGISTTVSLSRTSQLRARGKVNTYSSVATDVIEVLLKDGATTVAKWTFPANSSPSVTGTTQSQFFETPITGVSAGSHTYTLQVVRVTGSGNISIGAAADSLNWLTVERYL